MNKSFLVQTESTTIEVILEINRRFPFIETDQDDDGFGKV
jgi:hypothetical protein